jgi:hypothetical protein
MFRSPDCVTDGVLAPLEEAPPTTRTVSLSPLCGALLNHIYALVQPNLTLAILRYVGAPAVEPTTVNIPGAKLDDGLMHPIASEGPGNLGSGPADLAVTLNIAQPNAPFFDINGIVRPIFRLACAVLMPLGSRTSLPVCQCSCSF